MRRKIFIFAAIFVLAIICSGLISPLTVAAQNKKVYRWRMPTFLPPGGDMYMLMQQFCDDVKKASDGRLQITLYGAGQIMPVLQTWEACSRGVMDIVWSFGAYWTGKTKMAAISVGLPFTTTTMQEHAALLYEEGLEELIRKDYATQGIYLLRTFPIHHSVMCTKFPVASVDDLKGKKVRAGGMQAETVNAIGMASAFFPVPEVYGALDTGVVDAVIMGGIAASRQFSFFEVTKYIVQPPIDVACEEILINLKRWNNLPEDLKAILQACAAKAAYDRASYAAHREVVDLEFMKKEKGIKVARLSEEDIARMSSAAMAIYEKYAAESPAFAEALEMIKAHMKRKAP